MSYRMVDYSLIIIFLVSAANQKIARFRRKHLEIDLILRYNILFMN